VLGLLERAQRAGARVSTEAYPYGAGMTGIGAAFLAPERLAERGLTPQSIIYAPTGEEVSSAARLTELRAADPGGLAIIRQLDKNDPGCPFRRSWPRPACARRCCCRTGCRRCGARGGSAADIVVFDPDTITDQATYSASTRPSSGIRHVLVNGTFVVRDGQLDTSAQPGRPVRAGPAPGRAGRPARPWRSPAT